MVKTRGDRATIELLDWQPPEIIRRYEEPIVRASTLRSRIAHAVAATLRDCELPREEVARQMSAWLGEDVSRTMLDAYASEAREEKTIPYLRLMALVHVTGDMRLLQLGAELFAHSVVDDRYLRWVEVGKRALRKKEIAQIAEQEDHDFEVALKAARRGEES
ncbi:MAG: DNA transposition protein [Lentisphaerae bacterium]|nr:DNA transposition protein [Lentisphaerota bacterium]